MDSSCKREKFVIAGFEIVIDERVPDGYALLVDHMPDGDERIAGVLAFGSESTTSEAGRLWELAKASVSCTN